MVPVSVLTDQIYHSWNIPLLCLDVILFLAGLTVFLVLRQKSKKVALIAGCAVLILSFLDGNLYSHPNFRNRLPFCCFASGRDCWSLPAESCLR